MRTLKQKPWLSRLPYKHKLHIDENIKQFLDKSATGIQPSCQGSTFLALSLNIVSCVSVPPNKSHTYIFLLLFFFFNLETVQGLSCQGLFSTYFIDKINAFQEEFSGTMGAIWHFLKNSKMWLLITGNSFCNYERRKLANVTYRYGIWYVNNIVLKNKIT